jgi:hypothetical protein
VKSGGCSYLTKPLTAIRSNKMEKRCSRCGIVKDITLYPVDKRKPNGHAGSSCKDCHNLKRSRLNRLVTEDDKCCNECSVKKSYLEFNKDQKSLDGLSGKCGVCVTHKKKLTRLEYRKLNPITIRTYKSLSPADKLAARKVYREANNDLIKAQKKASYLRNRETTLAHVKKYTEANKEMKRKYAKKHYSENRHIYIAHARKREARLSSGINDVFIERFKEIYNIASAISEETGVKYQVDHIIPLIGYSMINGERKPVISGLHTPWNIQLLTENENRSKKNKFDGTYENESWKGMTWYGI